MPLVSIAIGVSSRKPHYCKSPPHVLFPFGVPFPEHPAGLFTQTALHFLKIEFISNFILKLRHHGTEKTGRHQKASFCHGVTKFIRLHFADVHLLGDTRILQSISFRKRMSAKPTFRVPTLIPKIFANTFHLAVIIGRLISPTKNRFSNDVMFT